MSDATTAIAATAELPPQVLMQLMWLASPALPVGGFSYSEGLEPAVESGRVHDEASATAWLNDQLQLALGRADLPLMAQAFAAWQQTDLPRIEALNDWLRQTRETSELRQQTEQMGRSLHLWLQQRHADDARVAALGRLQPAPNWPVAFALAACLTGAPLRESLVAHAFGWAENQVQAAIKSVPLGQSAGQRMLGQLTEAITAVVDRAITLGDGERMAFAPMLAILSAQHEAQYSRLFRS
ncbi:urease accessory protein UreF [Ideonella sp.]|uniref:urease accessory protein UreF n=1 Tax=Ideonella sp. TaxID=1929293 RepID=UPI003BB58756